MAMLSFAIGITAVNLLLLLILLRVYIQNYVKIRANINLGLIIFASVFAIQKATAIILFLTMMDHDSVVGVPMLILEILEFFGFSSLFWITVK
ncbi:MAG: hypothetical protein ACXAB7_08615 [Candidatus Kariarchaeaceae archaeon]|jgi:hypothetical protein